MAVAELPSVNPVGQAEEPTGMARLFGQHHDYGRYVDGAIVQSKRPAEGVNAVLSGDD
jgi:hypothetical protein